jgi:hypothetical protein
VLGGADAAAIRVDHAFPLSLPDAQGWCGEATRLLVWQCARVTPRSRHSPYSQRIYIYGSAEDGAMRRPAAYAQTLARAEDIAGVGHKRRHLGGCDKFLRRVTLHLGLD